MPSLIPPAIIAELDSKRQSWGMKGTGFVVVKKSAESGEWEREYVCLGVKDKEDRPFDKDVSECNMFQSSNWGVDETYMST